MNEKIIGEKLETIVSERFGTYSKYIIQDRALPNVKDGLKPVQRRILYGMYKMGMFANKPYKKSARIVGEVMGKYHPHGDSSIYDAMIRLSQNWKTNMLLIDMHGNNGSIDGDSAAAMRYTEARLSVIAEELLKDINKNTVDFIPNFDDEEYEPIVLPSKFPNLLVNGATGISSGYATDIPPHNLGEIIDGTIYRINNPYSTLNDIMEFIKGPDFPTGGIIQGLAGIKNAYQTGKGKVRIRALVEVVKNQLIITQIPYEINKAVLVRKIEELRLAKKIPGMVEVRDESDREGLRIVIDVKKDNDPNLIINYLYKTTDLQRNYSFNMVAIHNKRPVLMGLIEILDAYINHQKDVITNKSNFELTRVKKRLHIVDGLIRMVDILDQVIQTIRDSKNKANAKEMIIEKYEFSEIQAEAIVTLQLYRLSNTDIKDLRSEKRNLNNEITKLKKILSSEEELKRVIIDELSIIKDNLATDRKSLIEEELSEIKINEMELIPEEEVIVALSNDGYLKRSSLRSYNASGEENCGLKEKDVLKAIYEASTLDTMLLFTNKGNYIYLPVFKISEFKWKEVGTHISNLVLIDNDEHVINSILVKNFNLDIDVLIGTKNGMIKKTKLYEFEVQRYNKKLKAIKLKKTDEVVSVDFGTSEQDIVVYSSEGAAIRYHSTDISLLSTNALGVSSINLKNRANDKVVFSMFANENDDTILLSKKGNVIRTAVNKLDLLTRNRKPIQLTSNKKNTHDIVSAIKLTKTEYKGNIPIMLLASISNKEVEAYSIKYPTSINGKKYLNDSNGEPTGIVKINRLLEFNVSEIEREEQEEVKEAKKEYIDDYIDLDNLFEDNDNFSDNNSTKEIDNKKEEVKQEKLF
ncbi:DNA topoisomerase IV subunit A [Mycoplasmatota bacterium]|nr:DNA topoisomerase IV subunit A [Mycoplasmatota bacterium]